MTQMKFIGLDVHKETVAVAIADATRDGEVRFYGAIPNTPEAIRRLFDRLSGPGVELHFCYEAGGCGYGIYRQLRQLGASCMVIAPSMMPKKPGDRIKNNRRDSVTLARLLRAGELTAIGILLPNLTASLIHQQTVKDVRGFADCRGNSLRQNRLKSVTCRSDAAIALPE